MEKLVELALQAKSLEELMTLSKANGNQYQSEEDLIRELYWNWETEVNKRMKRESGLSSFAQQKLPPMELVKDGTTYSIYGIAHDKECGKDYIDLINRTVCADENWLIEQNLKKMLGISNGIEIVDHSVAPRSVSNPGKNYLGGILMGVLGPLFLAGLGVSGRVRRVRRQYKTIKKEFIQEIAKKTITGPLELFFENQDLPYYVDLELRERKSPPEYTGVQQRSAYQAEFMRFWNPSLSRQEKNILVGAAHAAEVVYFLQRGVKEQRITDLAGKHARLLEEDPEKYAALVKRTKLLETGVVVSSEILGVLTPYAMAGYFLF